MGWASGSELLGKVVSAVHTHVHDRAIRRSIYAEVISAFGDHDCDTMDECLGADKAYDDALKRYYKQMGYG